MVSMVRAFRLLKGLTLYQVSGATGIDVPRLSLFERGLGPLTAEEFSRLQEVLGIPFEPRISRHAKREEAQTSKRDRQPPANTRTQLAATSRDAQIKRRNRP